LTPVTPLTIRPFGIDGASFPARSRRAIATCSGSMILMRYCSPPTSKVAITAVLVGAEGEAVGGLGEGEAVGVAVGDGEALGLGVGVGGEVGAVALGLGVDGTVGSGVAVGAGAAEQAAAKNAESINRIRRECAVGKR